MPLLANLLVTLVSSFAAFLGQFITRKVAIILAALTALSTITIALLALFNAMVVPLVGQAFSTEYGQFLGLAFPPVAGNCLATIGSVWSGCTLYSWQKIALSISVQA